MGLHLLDWLIIATTVLLTAYVAVNHKYLTFGLFNRNKRRRAGKISGPRIPPKGPIIQKYDGLVLSSKNSDLVEATAYKLCSVAAEEDCVLKRESISDFDLDSLAFFDSSFPVILVFEEDKNLIEFLEALENNEVEAKIRPYHRRHLSSLCYALCGVGSPSFTEYVNSKLKALGGRSLIDWTMVDEKDGISEKWLARLVRCLLKK